MGRRGIPRTPTKILEMRGSWRAKRRTQEPTPPPASPTPPEWLDRAAKRLWRVWWKRLDACGILTQADEMSFARYVQTLARYIELQKWWNKHGAVYPRRGEDGEIKAFVVFPQACLLLKLSDDLLRLESAFGMTPASRAMVQKQEFSPHGNSSARKDKARFFAPLPPG